MFLRKLQEFMYGRYGGDTMNTVLLISGLVVSILGQLFNLTVLILIAYVFYGYSIIRILSKNIYARQKELYSFMKIWTPVQKWYKMRVMIWKDRKNYRYFKCPNCGQYLRAPKGRGKIEVTCQKCRKQFIKKV